MSCYDIANIHDQMSIKLIFTIDDRSYTIKLPKEWIIATMEEERPVEQYPQEPVE